MTSRTTRPSRIAALRGLGALTLTAGVVSQFVQRTDPTPPLLYFTVDSAVLAATVLAWRLARGPANSAWGDRTHSAAAVGVMLSTLVYAAVIVPSSPSGSWFGTHDDLWVRVATILLHGTSPALVLAEFLASPYRHAPILREAALGLWWPTSYLVVVGTLAWSGAAAMPYLFLRPSQFGATSTAAAIAALCAIAITIGASLSALHRLIQRAARRTGSSPTTPPKIRSADVRRDMDGTG